MMRVIFFSRMSSFSFYGNNIKLSPNPIHGKIKDTVLSMMWRKFIIDAEGIDD